MNAPNTYPETRYRVENSKVKFRLINDILGRDLQPDAHIRDHGLPVLPTAGDEIQSFRKLYRVVRRAFITQDGSSVEIYVVPVDPAEAEHHHRLAAERSKV